MTVIAWDGRTLAADKRAVNNGYAGGTVTKIYRWEGGLCAFSGDMDAGVQLVDWLRNGAVKTDYPKLQDDNAANFLVIHSDGRLLRYERTPIALEFQDKFTAMGSGRDYALAAMHLGYSAVEAVQTAIALDAGCGNGVDQLTIDQENQ